MNSSHKPLPFEQRRAKEAADKRKRDMELLARAAEDSRRMADAARAKREAAARQAEQEAAASGGVSKKVLNSFSVPHNWAHAAVHAVRVQDADDPNADLDLGLGQRPYMPR